MENSDQNPFPEGLYIEAQLPLHWKMRAAAPEPPQIQNQRLLRLLHLLEEGDGPAPDGNCTNPELERLEFKLDIMLELLTLLVRGQRQELEEVQINLGIDTLVWLSSSAISPTVGDRLDLFIHLDVRLPAPLVFEARVDGVSAATGGAQRITAKLVFADESEADLFSRFIFRKHRRRIAQERGGGRS